MNSVKVLSLCTLCKVKLTFASTCFCIYTHLKILLCAVCKNFAQKLCKLGSVFSLFKSILCKCGRNLGIAFSVCNSCHCKIHTDFAAFSLKVSSEILENIFAYALSNANLVNCCERCLLVHLLKFFLRCLTNRASLGSFGTFINITAYCAIPFHNYFSFVINISVLLPNI